MSMTPEETEALLVALETRFALKLKEPAPKEKTVAVLVRFPDSLMDRIEAIWHGRQLKSRAATLRLIIERGLAILEEGTPK